MGEAQGKIVALTLLLMVCLPISYSAYRFATWGREHCIMKLRVLIEPPAALRAEDPVYIRVYNLSAPGRLLEGVVELGSLPPGGLEFNFFMWRERRGFVEERVGGRWVRRPGYVLQYFAVTASARDREGGLWTASAIVTVDPYKPYGEAMLRFRKLASRQVAADQVPAPNQVRDTYDVMRGPPIDAISIPAGARYYVKIPIGMIVPMVAKEKDYWTDDPSTGVWWEEDWVNVATVNIDINGGVEGWSNGPASYYHYPQNIDVRMYTVAETTPVYTIRLFLVPMNLNGNVYVSGSLWSPCSGGTRVREIPYGDTAEYIWQRNSVWRIQSLTVSATFSAVTGKTVSITFSGGISVQIVVEYFEQRIQVVDWSKAPAGTTKLAVYACDPGNTLMRAQYEG
ncbi:MAG: hypothetical protein QW407_04620 [Thermofilaceae archaeon]